MISYNENENYNGKKGNINKSNIENIACLGKTISLYNKQQLRNI